MNISQTERDALNNVLGSIASVKGASADFISSSAELLSCYKDIYDASSNSVALADMKRLAAELEKLDRPVSDKLCYILNAYVCCANQSTPLD